ncbi:putative monocarboxylate transporter 6 isoform X2 [Apostichopus japonicus]|uniref:Putative monocarboxylate transporter 6 isoform X2 n=1 Tax=Stichopus japonicus TaxID=307972 RepID=A0A2G8KHM9_STIJA|nr:putative monocarboxylate transporter 6 isoform X2 [Apostichopus japonicus]
MQPIVRSLVGPKDFSGGFGLCLLSVGIGNLISATCAGLIYDVSENYTYVFLLPAALGTVSAVTVLLNHMVWGIWYKRSNWPKRNRPQRKDDGSGENGADENGADGDGADGHGADGHGADGHGADGHGADGDGVDGVGADGDGADDHGDGSPSRV